MENKINILANTLEQLLADCEDNGREGIQPILTPEDVKYILFALECAEPKSACIIPNDRIDPRSKTPLPLMQSEFVASIEGMTSPDYKERFRAEYIQTKVRYERLKAFNTKIEAAHRAMENCNCICVNPFDERVPKVEMPKHDCPDSLLREQQSIMGEYLHILEVRAVIEGVNLVGC